MDVMSIFLWSIIILMLIVCVFLSVDIWQLPMMRNFICKNCGMLFTGSRGDTSVCRKCMDGFKEMEE